MTRIYQGTPNTGQSVSCDGDAHAVQFIKTKFQKSFDPSRVIHFVKSRNSAHVEPIGEGTHFRSYRMRCGEDGIVVSLAKPTFRDGLRASQEEWRRRMYVVKGLSAPLIPPLEALWVEDQLALIMPYLPQAEEAALPHWQPLTEHIETLKQRLRQQGLYLADVIQIRCLNGVPFIMDWSDLDVLSRQAGF